MSQQIAVVVRFFAHMRDMAGCSELTVSSSAATVGDLYDELRIRFDFPASRANVRAAINDEFANMSTPVTPGLRVAFIPPVSGG
jgi:sulfur-carrier protein